MMRNPDECPQLPIQRKTVMEEDGLVPARMINEYCYCPRLCYIEWVEGEFKDSADTVEGRFQHRRVDRASGSAPEREEEGKQHTTSMLLSSTKLGIVGRIDLVEFEGGRAVPIDYKKGRAPDVPEGAYEPERVQVCALALILRDNGLECDRAIIYFVGSKKRVEIKISEELVQRTKEAIVGVRSLQMMSSPPLPLLDSPKCRGCSLVSICLPDETNLLRGEDEEVRRMNPARDDFMPVYVLTEGAVVAKREGRLEVRKEGQKIADVPLHDVSQVALHGSASITTPALSELMQRGIPVQYFSHGGWFIGQTTGTFNKNVFLRIRQFEAAADKEESLVLARSFVQGKVKNCRTLLRRNDKEVEDALLSQLGNLAKLTGTARSLGELLGIEGAAAQLYFSRLGSLLKGADAPSFEDRNRRPPRDPVNAVLSYLYGILTKEWFVTLLAVGFDPYRGFYHQPRHGKPALALDMMEEFRPLVADSVAITLFNNEELSLNDFVITKQGTNLAPEGKRTVVRGFERRMNTEIAHPLFGYSISYRRIFEVQARLLARKLMGEIPEYPPFCTR